MEEPCSNAAAKVRLTRMLTCELGRSGSRRVRMDPRSTSPGWIGGLGAAGFALFNENMVGEERLSLLQATAGVLGVASKVPQILTIWTEGGTGQLSAFAVSHAPTSMCKKHNH